MNDISVRQIGLLFNKGKFDGFSNFCYFFLEFSEKNRKFAIRYQLSQYFAMGKYINPFTDWGFKRLFGQEFSKDLLISFLNDLLVDEMHIRDVTFPFFDKKAEECESDFDKWIYVLKHMEALERMPFTAQKKIFKRLAELADSRCLSQEEQEKYDESLKAADDYYGVLMSYYMNGIDEGVAKGEAKGFAKGEARGFAKGEAKGSYHRSLDIAKKMLLKGMDDDSIMELTGLTHEQLHQLKS